ncbi:MAG: DUF444 family protein [Bacteroidales bacterium]|nr:DUF444 family protein [Bacteroidales bacterium]
MDKNEDIRKRDFQGNKHHYLPVDEHTDDLYLLNDALYFLQFNPFDFNQGISFLKTLDELIEKDKQREKDGFPRRIKIGKIVKPLPGNKAKVVVVPTTTEPKFYHDDSLSDDEEQQTGGSGDGDEGEVIGKQKIDPHQGEGEGEGAGQGESGDHDIATGAQELGKILTEEFQLPNLKNKGHKRSLTKYTYELTDRNREFGQLIDKKATIKQVLKTNIILGNIKEGKFFDPENLVINPKDKIFRIMSKEKDFEAQAIVFFIRDYSGSMQGAPTELVVSQHLMIYSWLMYQYQNNVESRFIVHDTQAKEVPDFYTYYKYQVAGGTEVYPAFELLNKIIEEEQLNKEYNIYVFYGTDGDDWEQSGEKMLTALKQSLSYTNRTGITIARNAWSQGKKTIVENYIENSGLLKEKADLLKLDALDAEEANDDAIIESIKKLIS